MESYLNKAFEIITSNIFLEGIGMLLCLSLSRYTYLYLKQEINNSVLRKDSKIAKDIIHLKHRLNCLESMVYADEIGVDDEEYFPECDDIDYDVKTRKERKRTGKKRKIETNVYEPISIETYNDKSFAVFGYTKEYRDELRELGGKWNTNLNRRKGWIFPNSKRQRVEEWLKN